MERLLRQHEWIATERAMFGRAGSYYDFNARDPEAAQALLREKLDEQSRCVAHLPLGTLRTQRMSQEWGCREDYMVCA